MKNILNLYCYGVLEKIENELKRQRKLTMKKGVFSSKNDKKYLEELENLWYEKLICFENLIEEERLFNKKLTNEYFRVLKEEKKYDNLTKNDIII